MNETLPLALLGLNLLTFLAFGHDKFRARRGGRRTPEATLLLLASLGGFPAGWLAMRLFRHKTIKRSFRLKMALVTVVNPVWPLLYLALAGP